MVTFVVFVGVGGYLAKNRPRSAPVPAPAAVVGEPQTEPPTRPRRERRKSERPFELDVETYDDMRSLTVRACKADEDCISVPGTCGFWEPINVKNRKRYETYVHSLSIRAKCAAMGPARYEATGKAHCATGVCVTDEKN